MSESICAFYSPGGGTGSRRRSNKLCDFYCRHHFDQRQNKHSGVFAYLCLSSQYSPFFFFFFLRNMVEKKQAFRFKKKPNSGRVSCSFTGNTLSETPVGGDFTLNVNNLPGSETQNFEKQIASHFSKHLVWYLSEIKDQKATLTSHHPLQKVNETFIRMVPMSQFRWNHVVIKFIWLGGKSGDIIGDKLLRSFKFRFSSLKASITSSPAVADCLDASTARTRKLVPKHFSTHVSKLVLKFRMWTRRCHLNSQCQTSTWCYS